MSSPSRWQVIAFGLALCFLSGVVGWWYAQPEEESFNTVDIGFLSDMSTHHRGAISMSFDYLGRANDPLVAHFAQEIVMAQTQEITIMNGLLGDAGDPKSASDDIAMEWMGTAMAPSEMPGMATASDVAQLRAAEGIAADDQFTALMIRHHVAGALMADHAAEHGENATVRELASAMARVQRTEVAEMNSRRRALGLDPVSVSDVAEELADSHAH